MEILAQQWLPYTGQEAARASTGEQFCRHQILQRIANALEDRDGAIIDSSRLFSAYQLVQISRDMIRLDDAFLNRNEQITRLGEHTIVSFDENASPLHGVGIHFAGVRLKRADEIQMGAGTKEPTLEKWRLRSCASADHVGFRGTGSRISGFDRQACFRGHLLGEVAARASVSAAHQHLLKPPDKWQDHNVRPRLPASAEHSEHARIFVGQELGRDRRSCGGAQVSEIVRRHNQHWLSGPWLQQHVSGLDSSFCARRVVLHHGKFHAQGLPDAVVTRHDKKYSRGQIHARTSRDDRRVIAIAKSSLNGGDDLAGLEPFADLIFAEQVHGVEGYQDKEPRARPKPHEHE